MDLKDKLEKIKATIESKDLRLNDSLWEPYPMDWPMFLGDSPLFEDVQDNKFIAEHDAWIKNREKYDFKEELQDAIRYFEKIFENALKELILLSEEFKKIFLVALNKLEDIQKADPDIEKVEFLFSKLYQFLEGNLRDKMKSFSTLNHALYKRKNAIIESITTESQFLEDVMEFLIVENRIVLIEKLMARIRGDVCILLYFTFRTYSERKQRDNTIDFFLYLIEHTLFLIRSEYREFLRDIELSFKQKKVPEGVRAQLQQLKEQYGNNEPTLSWKEIGIELGGKGQEYVRLLKHAMKRDDIEMISGNVTLRQAKEFVIRTGFHRTKNGYKCDRTGYEFTYSKKGKEKGKVTKKK